MVRVESYTSSLPVLQGGRAQSQQTDRTGLTNSTKPFLYQPVLASVWRAGTESGGTISMKAPACDPGDLWWSTKFLVSHLTFALDDEKVCILNVFLPTPPLFFYLHKVNVSKKKNYRTEHKRNAKCEIKWSSDNHLSLSFPVLSLNNLIVSLPICFLSI